MTQVEVLSAARDHVGGYKVDVTRGEVSVALRPRSLAFATYDDVWS
jgi:hypothetical protein